MLGAWGALYLPVCALIWFLTLSEDGDTDLVWDLETDTDTFVLHFRPLLLFLFSLMHLWIAEVGFEFLRLLKKTDQEREQEQLVNEKRERLQKMRSGTKVGKKDFTSKTLNYYS